MLMRCWFQGHMGSLNVNDHSVLFYGIRWNTPSEAIKFLDMLVPSDFYAPWCYMRHRGVKDLRDGQIYVNDHWFPNDQFAETFLKTCS